MQAPPERLGAFYLGAAYDLANGQRTETAINYDARDLTTHALCVGMTGSGKTGLCIGLMEEAGLDRVPAILIDPKGDITNLLLQFPDLRPEDFQPWVNVDDARRKGQSVEEYAQATADQWRAGLADWGVDPERIRSLKESVDYTIFTPGSDAGVPVNIMGSLAAPKLSFDTDAEAIRERISGTVAALLGLAGVKADPVRSREAILLANIFEHYWRQNLDLDLAQLILSIQKPPVRQLGVFEVDTFYPEKDRFELAMAFNNLVAAPTFQTWLQGEPLDVDQLFYTADGTPRHSIFYIAHLSDSERMFFVTLLLENLLTWMRRQSGTTSLRALLYFDEIFGFFPPTAEPPSKRPMLTLLKQARAFGLGLVLVTQNPVDLDYKGLTNAGTWFIGKLQAERDKDRVLAGLKGAIAEAGGRESVDYGELISRLSSRVFLLHNVHEDEPVVFQTRWAMSYLRGPLTRPQVRDLMVRTKPAQMNAPPTPAPAIAASAATAPPAPAAAPVPSPAGMAAPAGFSTAPPVLDSAVEQRFLPAVLADNAAVRALMQETRSADVRSVRLVYESAVLAAASVRYVERKWALDQQTALLFLATQVDQPAGVDWAAAEALELDVRDLLLRSEPVGAEQGPFYAPVPEQANSARRLKSMATDLSDWLYYNSRLAVRVHPQLGLRQTPDEREREFNLRLQQAAREARDAEVDGLRRKFEADIAKVEEKVRREERELEKDRADYDARKQQEMIGIGESVLGYFFGRRSSRAFSTAASRRRMTSKAGQDVAESEQVISELKSEVDDLRRQLEAQVNDITVRWANLMDDTESVEVSPRRTDVNVTLLALAWVPSWHITYHDGVAERSRVIPAYKRPADGPA